MENVNKPILIAGGKPVNSQWNKKNDLNDIDTILKLNPTGVEESQSNTDYEPNYQEIESYNRSEGARLGDISKTVFNTGNEKIKTINVPSPIDQTQEIPAGKVGNASAPTTQAAPRTTINDSVVPPSTTGSVIPAPTVTPVSTSNSNVKNISFPGADESKEAEMNDLRKKFFDYISPYLDAHHPLGQIMEYLDDSISSAISDGPKKGSLNGKIITYYPQKGEFISMIAIYSDDRKRPKDFFKEVEKYFDSMMNLAGKPKATPINP